MPNTSDMDFLIQALPLLLHDHDCLVIPGLGGFVAHPVAGYGTLTAAASLLIEYIFLVMMHP